MSSNPNDVRQWIQELIQRSATDQLHNLQRFEEMVRRASHGEFDGDTLRSEYLQFAREESARYISDLTRVGLSFYNTLIELNRNYNDRFFERASTANHRQNGTSDGGESELHVVEMDLRGPLRGEARRTFVIENRRAEAVSVSFLVSEFADESGQTSFRPPLQLSPARFSMQPGEERQVHLSIPLLEEFFSVGPVYSATLIASGFQNLHLHLNVRADAPVSPNGSSGHAAKPADGGLIFQSVDAGPPVEGDTGRET
jgi:hypothetical protein